MPHVVVDTREQNPYRFEGSVRGTLPTGDYSLLGSEDQVAIERKSLEDALGSLGGDRDRFRREVERLAGLDYGAVVVEASFEGILAGSPRSRMHPGAALHSLLSWSVELGVPVWFPGRRELARGLTYHLLRHWWRKRHVQRLPGSVDKKRGRAHGTQSPNSGNKYDTPISTF